MSLRRSVLEAKGWQLGLWLFCYLDDVFQWVAVNLVDFFNSLNLFLSVTPECCNGTSCPTMSAGPGYVGSTSCRRSVSLMSKWLIRTTFSMDYTWTSTTGGTKKQVKVPAPQYVRPCFWVLPLPSSYPLKLPVCLRSAHRSTMSWRGLRNSWRMRAHFLRRLVESSTLTPFLPALDTCTPNSSESLLTSTMPILITFFMCVTSFSRLSP